MTKTITHMRIRSLWYKKIYFYLKSGQSISEALQYSTSDSYIKNIAKEVLSGQRFSDACASYRSAVFTPTELSLLDTAEHTGTLQKVVYFLSDVLKNWYTQKQKALTASIYPLVVLILTAGLLVGILAFIVPKIRSLFMDLDHIPVTTRLLIWSSDVFLKYWSSFTLVFVALILIRFSVSKTERYRSGSRKFWTYLVLHLPYIRDVYVFWNIEKWVHVFSICLENNIALEKSFTLATNSIDNRYIKDCFEQPLSKVRQGFSCADSLQALPTHIYKQLEDWYPIIRSGESSSSLKDVFFVFHEYIKTNLDRLFEKIQKYVEPLLILMIGGIVLTVAVSIILPMYQLTQSIQ